MIGSADVHMEYYTRQLAVARSKRRPSTTDGLTIGSADTHMEYYTRQLAGTRPARKPFTFHDHSICNMRPLHSPLPLAGGAGFPSLAAGKALEKRGGNLPIYSPTTWLRLYFVKPSRVASPACGGGVKTGVVLQPCFTLHTLLSLLLLPVVMLSGTAVSMAAQSLIPDDVLLFRKRTVSDYLPVGIRAGSFLISPGIGIDATYDDNIFRTPSNRQSDFITTVKPAFAIQSNWNRHSIFFGAEGDFGFYADNTDENFEDYGVILSGRYDIAEDTYLMLAISQAQRHISRGALFDPVAAAPSEYEVTRQQFQFVRELGRLQLELYGQNEDVRLLGSSATGVPLTSFTTRDGQQLGGRLALEYMPDNSLFASLTYDQQDYALPSGARRNATGHDVKAGWEFDTARSLRGSLYSTYINRDYTANTSDTDRFYPGGRIEWDITGLATLSAALDTSFNETTVAGAAGVIRTTRKMALQYQATDRLRTEVSTGLNNYRYAGGEGSINRGTQVRYHGLGALFQANQHVGIRARYDYQRRTSPLPSDAYKDNRVSLSLTYMY